jgi:hypothetical protein
MQKKVCFSKVGSSQYEGFEKLFGGGQKINLHGLGSYILNKNGLRWNGDPDTKDAAKQESFENYGMVKRPFRGASRKPSRN